MTESAEKGSNFGTAHNFASESYSENPTCDALSIHVTQR